MQLEILLGTAAQTALNAARSLALAFAFTLRTAPRAPSGRTGSFSTRCFTPRCATTLCRYWKPLSDNCETAQ